MSSRASIGTAKIAGVPAATNQGFISFVCEGGKLSSRFLRYIIDSHLGEYFEAIAPGTTFKEIGRGVVKQERVSFPSKDKQEQIANYLDTSCSAIDSAIASKRRQLESLAGIRKSLLQRIVTRGISETPVLIATGNCWLDQIPQGWSLVMLKRLATVQGGITLGKSYEDQETVEYPYLRVANVQDGYVDLDDVTLLDVPTGVAAGVMLRAGDVLMTEGGDLDKLGRGTVWNGQIEPCLHQNHVFAVRCRTHKLLPHFLAYVTAAQYGRDYFEATGKRTTNLAATNSTKVGSFYIPLPSVDEQRKLIAHLDTELGRLAAIEATIRKQIDTLLAYRKSLIHECVTGKRRVTSADSLRHGPNG